MSNVGLYLGTFNPIHNGHVTLAKYFSELPELDQVLVVISPQSPFKIEDTFMSFTSPTSKKIINSIENLLN